MEHEREYALDLVMEAKRIRKTVEEKRALRERWEKRLALAREAGRSDLEEAAGNEIAALDSEIQRLEVEEAMLAKEVEQAKAEYRTARIRGGLSVDAEALAESLEAEAGPADPAGRELDELGRQAEADAALEALKKEMGLAGDSE